VKAGGAAALAALVAVIAVAAFAGRHYLSEHVFASNAPIAGVGGKILPGRTFDQREKLRPGQSLREVTGLLGDPTYRFGQSEKNGYVRWVYEYADGKLLLTIGGGYVVQVDTTFK
jgi:hypothetical protein